MANGATLDIALNSATLTNDVTINIDGNGSANIGALTFTGSDITLNNPIALVGDSLIGGTASGNINLNATINGASNLNISNRNGDFNFNALDITNNVYISANNATGIIAVGGLSLDTNACNLTGTVSGESGVTGANKIIIVNNIQPNTHFFDGIDLYSPSGNNSSNTLPQQTLTQVATILFYVPNSLVFDYEESSSIYNIENNYGVEVSEVVNNFESSSTPGVKCINLTKDILICSQT